MRIRTWSRVVALGVLSLQALVSFAVHAADTDETKLLDQLKQQLAQSAKGSSVPAVTPSQTPNDSVNQLLQRLEGKDKPAPTLIADDSAPRMVSNYGNDTAVLGVDAGASGGAAVGGGAGTGTATTPLNDPLLNQRAFDEVVRHISPMTPEQIVALRAAFESSQRASVAPATAPPRPVAITQVVNLAPGASPPAIRLSQGYVSSILFVDSTGAPWPITGYSVGDPSAFAIQWDQRSNLLMIQAKTLSQFGNMAIRLRELGTPVVLTLVPGQQVVDYRVDLHIPGLGPYAKLAPMGSSHPPSADSALLTMLAGVAPEGGRSVRVDGCGDCKGWVWQEKLYLRTPFAVLSPGWIQSMRSPDGTQIYEFANASQIGRLLMSHQGQIVTAVVTGTGSKTS